MVRRWRREVKGQSRETKKNKVAPRNIIQRNIFSYLTSVTFQQLHQQISASEWPPADNDTYIDLDIKLYVLCKLISAS